MSAVGVARAASRRAAVGSRRGFRPPHAKGRRLRPRLMQRRPGRWRRDRRALDSHGREQLRGPYFNRRLAPAASPGPLTGRAAPPIAPPRAAANEHFTDSTKPGQAAAADGAAASRADPDGDAGVRVPGRLDRARLRNLAAAPPPQPAPLAVWGRAGYCSSSGPVVPSSGLHTPGGCRFRRLWGAAGGQEGGEGTTRAEARGRCLHGPRNGTSACGSLWATETKK